MGRLGRRRRWRGFEGFAFSNIQGMCVNNPSIGIDTNQISDMMGLMWKQLFRSFLGYETIYMKIERKVTSCRILCLSKECEIDGDVLLDSEVFFSLQVRSHLVRTYEGL